MSKSFREKKSRDRDVYDSGHNYKRTDRSIKRIEKGVHRALRTNDINALMKFTEEDEYADI